MRRRALRQRRRRILQWLRLAFGPTTPAARRRRARLLALTLAVAVILVPSSARAGACDWEWAGIAELTPVQCQSPQAVAAADACGEPGQLACEVPVVLAGEMPGTVAAGLALVVLLLAARTVGGFSRKERM